MKEDTHHSIWALVYMPSPTFSGDKADHLAGPRWRYPGFGGYFVDGWSTKSAPSSDELNRTVERDQRRFPHRASKDYALMKIMDYPQVRFR
jgi:hypothetical protein